MDSQHTHFAFHSVPSWVAMPAVAAIRPMPRLPGSKSDTREPEPERMGVLLDTRRAPSVRSPHARTPYAHVWPGAVAPSEQSR